MDEQLESIASEVVSLFWRHFESEIKEAFERKLIQVAGEAWRHRWASEERMSALIHTAIDEQLATTFKPVLDEIAKEKARKKVEARAIKNDVEVDSLPWPE